MNRSVPAVSAALQASPRAAGVVPADAGAAAAPVFDAARLALYDALYSKQMAPSVSRTASARSCC